MVTTESSPSGKIPTVEPGIESGTSWLVGRDWPRDHEAGHNMEYNFSVFKTLCGYD